MKDTNVEKGAHGRAQFLYDEKRKVFNMARGAAILYAAGVMAAMFAKIAITQSIWSFLGLIGAILLAVAVKASMNAAKLKALKDVGQYEYEKIKAVTDEKEWMTLLADLFMKTADGDMTLWLTVVTGGNIYMYVPEQTMKSDEIEAAVIAMINDPQKRRIYAYESFDEFEDMIMMLAANRPMKKEDDSKEICDLLLKQAL